MSSQTLNETRHGATRDVVAPSLGTLAQAALVGVVVGTGAQFLRQRIGPLGALGGSTAPWVTIGFFLALRAARRRPLLDAAVGGAIVWAVYLLAWLFAYHAVFALRESVALPAAWSQARPWIVAVTPVSVGIGVVAALAQRPGRVRPVFLAAPLVWSLPEVVRAVERGWSYALVVGAPTLALALVATLSCRRIA